MEMAMLQQADSEVMQAFNAQQGVAMPSKLIATFFMEAVQDNEASAAAGRPIYRDEEFVEIRVPGDKDEIRRRPVRFMDKQQFPAQYAAFKANREAPMEGTPLDKVPFLTKAQVLEFQSVGLKTAEHVRDMADSLAQRFMGIHQVRKQITDFLAAAEGAAPAQKLQAELEKRDNEIEALKNLIDQQNKRLDDIGKRRG